MFFAGLKFLLGMATGTILLFGAVAGLVVIAECTTSWNKKRRRTRRMGNRPATESLVRNALILVVRCHQPECTAPENHRQTIGY